MSETSIEIRLWVESKIVCKFHTDISALPKVVLALREVGYVPDVTAENVRTWGASRDPYIDLRPEGKTLRVDRLLAALDASAHEPSSIPRKGVASVAISIPSQTLVVYALRQLGVEALLTGK